jgi:hypothetical protein
MNAAPLQISKQLAVLCALLLLVASTPACIKNSNLTAPQLATYQVNRTIAALAEVNKGVASSAIKLNELKLIQPDLTNEILNYTRDIAGAVKSSSVILQSGKNWAVAAPEVLALLQGIPFPGKVSAFLRDPGADQGILALVSIIHTTQILITQGIVEVKK